MSVLVFWDSLDRGGKKPCTLPLTNRELKTDRFWPVAVVDEERESANRELFCGGLAALRLGLELSTKLGATHFF